ncbi:hypothetical protein SYNPS1DRAFT_11705 [Syncephalis pseudoplumigaleata]|uniref:Trm112p-domain-containing protein n=1 Tax=Syncephalis pseudoplumigaleata TaxID=1712513 RepID=A0A4P9Z8N9_9FUNG|nr:hypothetical protein SYNPS1DRAFT_11705 [Syncephalis pseudoplumigaleata]|eukprot:RKP28110.1 hypothetical protein SYNPS1DRAFT_11705 [Syncephalis pseudoplumigaleata]
MRLLTHNMLQCHARGCTTRNYPLRFEEVRLDTEEKTEVNPDFIMGMLPKLDWAALRTTAMQLGMTELPEQAPDTTMDEATIHALHAILLDTRVMEGKMVCDGCGHVYRIKDGVANMLLTEHEV